MQNEMFEETKEENLDNNSWLSTTKTVFKIALIGAAGVGKTSILHRIGGMRFDPRYCPTVGYKEYVVDMLGVRLLIKEYPGQERYQTVYDTNIDGILVVTTASALDTRTAFEMMRKMPDNIPYCFVENKSDIRMKNLNMCCSVKTNHNLIEPFQDLLNQMQS